MLPTMMQQVDEMMLHMDDSNSSDDDNIVGSNDKNNDANYTHPAAATRSGWNKKQKLVLLDSGDVLATISKVKRRMMAIMTILIVQVALKIYYCRGGSGKQRGSEINR